MFVPGWEGNISVKWLRRIKVVDAPYETREETSKYTDLMPTGKACQFTFEMDPKSLITFPSADRSCKDPDSTKSRDSRGRVAGRSAGRNIHGRRPQLEGRDVADSCPPDRVHTLHIWMEMGWQ